MPVEQSPALLINTLIIILCALTDSMIPITHIRLPFEMVWVAVVPHTLSGPTGDTPTFVTLAGRSVVKEGNEECKGKQGCHFCGS